MTDTVSSVTMSFYIFHLPYDVTVIQWGHIMSLKSYDHMSHQHHDTIPVKVMFCTAIS